jgi:hypothetical protein
LRYRSFVEEEFVREIESPFEAIRWQRERGKEGKRERGKERVSPFFFSLSPALVKRCVK